MIIEVNNSPREISNVFSLQKLVEELAISTNGIAIAINNTIVKKEDWKTKLLQENDKVLIIRSTQGG